jgi:twinkle protein
MGCGYYAYSNSDAVGYNQHEEKKSMDLLQLEYRSIPSRGLTEESCRKWGYGIAQYKGKVTNYKTQTVQIATYRNGEGTPVAQKVRTKTKAFTLIGDTKHKELYGRHLWKGNGDRRGITITEGELDAISISQSKDHKYPVVSIPGGAAGAKLAIQHNLSWLEEFEKVVFCFDMDEAGHKAAKECAALLSPGKSFFMELPLKDANEMLVAKRTKELTDAFFRAKPYAPEGLADISLLIEEAVRPVVRGVPYPWKDLDDKLYGLMAPSLVLVGAGVGVGKTDFVAEIVNNCVLNLGIPIGIFSFEINPVTFLQQLACKEDGIPYHLPDQEFDVEELRNTLECMNALGTLNLYDHVGISDWLKVKSTIRYLKHVKGVNLFIIDNLTQLATARDVEERIELENIMGEAASLVQELNICIMFISHLVAPEKGKTHEEGAMVLPRHFKGSRAIQQWAHVMLGLERNTLAVESNERTLTRIRVLKNRLVGSSTGSVLHFRYNEKSYRLESVDAAALAAFDEDVDTDF